MKRIYTAVGMFALVAVCALAISACGRSQADQVRRNEQKYTGNQLAALEKAEPFPFFHDSGNRRNQNYYYTAEADPNKIWYLALIGLDGTPYATYEIKGPVSSTNDQVTNPVQRSGGSGAVIGQAEPDGTYSGDHQNEHVAITTSGAVVKWVGYYVTQDQPFVIKIPIRLQANESVRPTKTDLGKSQGGRIPGRK